MKIFNTLTRNKEEFKTVNENIVNMYVCGPTVYDLFHIGNARTFVFFDVVRRYLEYKGYEVNFVQNFTDIDDKIINKAAIEKKNIRDISEKYIEEYYFDADSLNIKRAVKNPKATENIEEMVKLIEELISFGYAYEINGDVFFSVRRFKEYGKLFGQNLDSLKSGSRIKVNENKKDSLDFNLWKKSKEGEPSYNSPWGYGRPGWHTECCSMIYKYFNGITIDIHGGGIDLVFPHHENEIAQIEVLSNKKLANYWMHCSFLNINDEKMSKSLGNFLTIKDILSKYSSNVFRFFILSSHYRSIISFNDEQMIVSQKSFSKIEKTYNLIVEKSNKKEFSNSNDKLGVIKSYKDKFIDRMDDDFNTSDGISVIFEFIRYINTNIDELGDLEVKECISFMDEFFNIFGFEMNEIVEKDIDDKILELINMRNEFKLSKNFQKADSLRDELYELGFILEDIKSAVRVIDRNNNKILKIISY